MAPLARTLHLTLDACDATVVRRFIDDGDLPNLSAFLRRAATVPTEAPYGLFVSSLWPTMFTATTVERHGYHCWDAIDPITYERRETSPDEIIGTPFWELLSDAGQRVAVLDVPHSKVRRPIDGVLLVEWGCHDRHFGTHSWPADLVDDLAATVGPHPVGCADVGRSQFAPDDYLFREGRHRTPDEDAALLDALLLGIERKEAASLRLLGRGGWDLFLAVFGESHAVGHQLWRVSDPSHPWHDPAVAARLGDPLRRVYRRLDEAVARLCDAVGDDATVFVHLSHGMAAHYDGTHLLQDILNRLEDQAEGRAHLGWRTRAAALVAPHVPDRLRHRAIGAVAPLVRRRIDSRPPSPPGPDDPWSNLLDRLWFQAPNNTVTGGIRLNLGGREPSGRIPAGEQRRALEWLRRELLQIVNVDTGRPAVVDAQLTEDVCDRRVGDALPDLFVEWDRSTMIDRVWSPTIGTIVRPYDHWRTGDHTREGLLAAAGPGIRAGRRAGVIETVDIAPTIAATLGVELPGVDGRPRQDLLPGGPINGSKRPLEAPVWDAATATDRVADRISASIGGLRRRLEGLSAAHHVTRLLAREASSAASASVAQLTALRGDLAQLEGRTDKLEAMQAATTWAAHVPARNELLVSVVMPTRNRVDALARAIGSVQAQRHTRWELLVVDDGSDDGTPDFLAGVEDPRVFTFHSGGIGCAAARNVALDAARGDVITYLDDDNLFHPDWLVAVSWMFSSLPDLRVGYGARVIEDLPRALGQPVEGRPVVHLSDWDRDVVEQGNTLDMNVLAHRPSSVRFDERIAYFGDWDLILKLSEESDPMPIPVIAALYSTSTPNRMTDVVSAEAKHAESLLVREGLATRSRARRRSG